MEETNSERMKELTEFDNTRAGVKGLVDSGIKKIPRIFINKPENLQNPKYMADTNLQIPVINLEGIGNDSIRNKLVKEVFEASKSWGFFQLLNHGIPSSVLDNMMQGSRKFHELDVEIKAKYYTRDLKKKVRYSSNFQLFTAPVADWRDSISTVFDGSITDEELPSVFREEILEYKQHVCNVAETVCELLSEALGLNPSYLKSINSIAIQSVTGHYYPPCPEPELTLGTTKHTDPSFLTLLLQDDSGGLQVLHQNQWVPVAPLQGALLVNIGDLLQLISNDKFKSVKHRVLASGVGPRSSVATFFAPNPSETRPYGPIKEALSDENPSIYKDILVMDYLTHVVTMGLRGESALNHFKI